MSTISGTSGASSAWSGMSSARASSRADRMFSKVDADGSGSVDKTELQGMLDDIAQKTGNTLGSADDLMTKMDTDGNGSLSKDELASGMKSLMPPPSSTVDFAQQSGAGGMPPPPPPDGGPQSSDSSSSTTSTDPLDTNGDGVVSADERAAGEMADAVKQLFAAADTNGDKSISKSEADTFKQKVETVLQGLEGASSSSSAASQPSSCESSSASSSSSSDSSSSDSSSSSSSASSNLTLQSFIDLVLKQYGQTAAASGASSDTSLSITA